MKECRDRSENATNRKLWKFWIETVFKKNSTPTNYFFSMTKNLKKSSKCWRKKINTIFIFSFEILIFKKLNQNFAKKNFFSRNFFLHRKKIIFCRSWKKIWVQFRCRKTISFDWWHFRSDSDTPSQVLKLILWVVVKGRSWPCLFKES